MPEEFFQKALHSYGVAGFGRRSFISKNFGRNFIAVEGVKALYMISFPFTSLLTRVLQLFLTSSCPRRPHHQLSPCSHLSVLNFISRFLHRFITNNEA